jgi:hypothetical protein
MNKNQPTRRKGPFDMRDVKRLVFLLAVSATLGFWALFSNKYIHVGSVAQSSGAAVVEAPPDPTQEVLVLELPPIPTLVPTSMPGQAELRTMAGPSPTPVSTSSVRIVIGGPAPSAGGTRVRSESRGGNSSEPAPVTITRSSQ